MQLYHGSPQKVEAPSLAKAKANNDYGRGFYCTEDIEMAKEWAVRKGAQGFANCYEFNAEGLRIINLQSEDYSVLNWIALLCKNRRFDPEREVEDRAMQYLLAYFLPDAADADVIIGYRADDSYFTFAKDFVSNVLTLRQLRKALELGKLGVQVALVSEKAIQRLKFIHAEAVEGAEYTMRWTIRERLATSDYRKKVSVSETFDDDIFIMDIVRGRMKHGDSRLR